MDKNSMFVFGEDGKTIEECDLGSVKLDGEAGDTLDTRVKASDIFKVGQVWKNRNLVRDVVHVYASRTGWQETLLNTDIKCTCYKTKKLKRNYSSGTSLHYGCKWRIVMKSTKNKSVTNNNTGKSRNRPDFSDNIPVEITVTDLEHTGNCKPSPQQQLVQRSRSGTYTSGVSTQSIFTLCTIYKNQQKLLPQTIKGVLRGNYPTNKNITKHEIYYFKNKIKKLTPQLDNVESYQDFEALINTSNIKFGMDNENITDDTIAETARDIWKEIMNSSSSDDFSAFIDFMNLVSMKNKGFRYKMFCDTEGAYTGCVWQTAVMRDNFNRFGNYAMIDAMKRGINVFLWPYLAMAMVNELNMICLACEALMCAERVEAYTCMIDFILENSTSRKREEIFILSADAFVDQDVVSNKFNLPNCHFSLDEFHIFFSILPKRFGPFHYQIIEEDLRSMVNAKSEDSFKEAFECAKKKLLQLPNRSANAESELELFYNERECYALYIIKLKRGSMGLRGSTGSEINNSSVLINLNDGERTVNTYCESPTTLVKDLMQRQHNHIIKWNKELYSQKMRLNTEISQFNSSTHPALVSAASSLCYNSYLRFKDKIKDIKTYPYEVEVVSDTLRQVKSKVFKNAKVHYCRKNKDESFFRCDDCHQSVAYEEQCIHGILANDGTFVKELFSCRHFRRDSVQGSYIDNNITQNIQEETSEISYPHGTSVEMDSDSQSNLSEDLSIDETMMLDDNNKNHNNDVNPLSNKQVKQTWDRIFGKYDSCSRESKFLFSSLLVSLEEIATSDGKSRGLLDTSTAGEEGGVVASMKNIIEKHNKSFLASTDTFVSAPQTNIPSQSQVSQASKTRLMTTREKTIRQKSSSLSSSRVRAGSKKTSSCTFCGSTEKGHQKESNCTKRSALRAKSTEYIFGGRSTDSSANLASFRRKMEHDTSFHHPDTETNLLHTLTPNKHIYIHRAWVDVAGHGHSYKLETMRFEVSYINGMGDVQEKKEQITGQCLYNKLCRYCTSMTKKYYVYDGTPSKTARAPSTLRPNIPDMSLFGLQMMMNQIPTQSSQNSIGTHQREFFLPHTQSQGQNNNNSYFGYNDTHGDNHEYHFGNI